jgi:hypothetical protein
MLNFSNQDHLAQKIAIHYARLMDNQYALDVFSLTVDVSTESEAEAITLCFWNMVDRAAEDEDQDQDKEIEGAVDLQYWMQRLMNILAGHMNQIGFGDIWVKASDASNGR